MSTDGIIIPIAFQYNFRGKKYCEAGLHFTKIPINQNRIDQIQRGSKNRIKIDKFIKNSEFGKTQCLVPIVLKTVGNYEAPWGMRFAIGTLSENPTTATKLERISFLACSEEHAEIMMEKNVACAPFYISIKDGIFFLNGKDDSGAKNVLACRNYNTACWDEFAHPSIHVEKSKGWININLMESISWIELFKIDNNNNLQLNQTDNDTIDSIENKRMPVLPLKKAYEFAEKNGLIFESNEIEGPKTEVHGLKSTTIRRILFIRLFEKKSLFQKFIDDDWLLGKTVLGIRAIAKYKEKGKLFDNNNSNPIVTNILENKATYCAAYRHSCC